MEGNRRGYRAEEEGSYLRLLPALVASPYLASPTGTVKSRSIPCWLAWTSNGTMNSNCLRCARPLCLDGHGGSKVDEVIGGRHPPAQGILQPGLFVVLEELRVKFRLGGAPRPRTPWLLVFSDAIPETLDSSTTRPSSNTSVNPMGKP